MGHPATSVSCGRLFNPAAQLDTLSTKNDLLSPSPENVNILVFSSLTCAGC